MFDELGYEILEGLVSPEQAKIFISILTKLKMEPLRGGIRRIDKMVPEISSLAVSPQLISTAQKYLPGIPSLVRAIYFDKSSENNWYVTWHQDRTVEVSKKFDLPGWGPWSIKADAFHVQPPIQVLNEMVTIRIHLDPTDRSNGCLKVMPGSQKIGLLHSSEVSDYVNEKSSVYCEVPAGGAVVMRPHLLHASEKSVNNEPRCVLHFEYSSFHLPQGINWCESHPLVIS